MKKIGIIGGMGPVAGADLFLKIVQETRAERDQEHIPVLLYSDTNIPDRTAAILSGGEDPRPELIHAAKTLANAGAELLAMSCNTAHYFYGDIAASVAVPLLHMPEETAIYAQKRGYKKAALLSTTGTVAAGVYASAFAQKAPGVELLLPDEGGQREVMGLIYDGVKKGDPGYSAAGVQQVLEELRSRGAEAFILGCTELPIAFAQGIVRCPADQLIDPTLVLARAAVLAAGGVLKNTGIAV